MQKLLNSPCAPSTERLPDPRAKHDDPVSALKLPLFRNKQRSRDAQNEVLEIQVTTVGPGVRVRRIKVTNATSDPPGADLANVLVDRPDSAHDLDQRE